MPEHMALANYTLAQRHEKKESQFEFASNCGISPDTLSMIEQGKANPRLDTIQKIAAYTGDTVAEILTVNEEVIYEIQIYNR